MAYAFTYLPVPQHATANAAIDWFKTNWGLPVKGIEVEVEVARDLRLRPTFVAQTRDHHTLCIEVMDQAYGQGIDSFILGCQKSCLPVLMFVAVPNGFKDRDFGANLRDARTAGVGILEVDAASGYMHCNALSTSLTGVRAVDVKAFPPKYRQSLQQAEQSFRDGQPAKACSMVYDEIEAAFFRFAEKCSKKGLWNPNNIDLQKVGWANLIKAMNSLDRSHKATKKVTDLLLASMLSVTPHRNDSGHKPKNRAQLINRDKKLRTRFENAADLLQEFLSATSMLKP